MRLSQLRAPGLQCAGRHIKPASLQPSCGIHSSCFLPAPLHAPPATAGKLPFEDAPQDDRRLADIHLALYNDAVVFDHATKLAYVIAWVSAESRLLSLLLRPLRGCVGRC